MQKRQNKREQPPPKPGTITGFKSQARDPKRISVFLDGEFAFGLYVDILSENALEKGQFLDVERQLELIRADNVIRAKFSALNFLAYRARTAKEVHDRLISKGFCPDVAESVVERFTELGYINDSNFARQYANGRVRNKGYGPRRIQQELRRKGVASQHIQEALDQSVLEVDPFDSALKAGEKRWARLSNESNPMKRRKKLQDFLARRGFGFDTIRKVLEELQRME